MNPRNTELLDGETKYDPFNRMRVEPDPYIVVLQELKELKARIADLEHGRTPEQEKRKTLGEICEDAFDLGFRGNDAAKAVAEAIIERHLNDWQCMDEIAAAIRKEFEE